MSREVKRVAANFRWPENKVWDGYFKDEKVEPPSGDWWQLWEDVSEGSPVTPSFETKEELIEWLVTHGDSSDRHAGRGGWTRQAAEQIVEMGWAPSMIFTGGRAYTPRTGFPRE